MLLGIVSLLMRDPPRGQSDRARVAGRPRWRDYVALAKNLSYVLNTLGMAALTFAIGGISYWMPRYLTRARGLPASSKVTFGAILCVAGLLATLSGGMAGDRVERRYAGAYFLVSAIGIFLACPFIVLMLYSPFPLAWVWIFCTIFFLFFNTGPANTILANVTHPSVRASAFAINIFVIHALGDAPSPPLLGGIAGRRGWNVAFGVVIAVMLLAAGFWMVGMRYLKRDTERISGPGTGGKEMT
jgi:sugar phosphate permease